MATMKAIQRYGGSRDVDVMLQANEEHELFIAQGRSAQYTEITRGGELWSVISAAASQARTSSGSCEIFEGAGISEKHPWESTSHRPRCQPDT